VPKVSSDTDTQNFDKFEEQEAGEDDTSSGKNGESQNHFDGFTFKRAEKPKAMGSDFFDGASLSHQLLSD
jgi:hypothetical protein